MKYTATLSAVQVGQAVKSLLLLGERKITIEETEKDRFVVTTTTETALSKKSTNSISRKGVKNNCHPYSSYERGSNENVNRMIRRWFPKGTDFRKVTAKAIQKVEDWINNYPREILGFRTAEAVFQEGVACLT